MDKGLAIATVLAAAIACFAAFGLGNTTYVLLLPAGIAIACAAVALGIDSAHFWAPLLLLLSLEPKTALGTAITIQVFGFGSGIAANMRKKTIDYQIAVHLLKYTIPFAIAGSILFLMAPQNLLKAALGVFLLAASLQFLYRGFFEPEALEEASLDKVRHRLRSPLGKTMAGLAGSFIGLVSVGGGEFLDYFLIIRHKLPGKIAVPTNIFIIGVTAVVSAGIKIWQGTLEPTALLYAVPGVLIGGQLGSHLSLRMNQHTRLRLLGMFFFALGIFTLFSG